MGDELGNETDVAVLLAPSNVYTSCHLNQERRTAIAFLPKRWKNSKPFGTFRIFGYVSILETSRPACALQCRGDYLQFASPDS